MGEFSWIIGAASLALTAGGILFYTGRWVGSSSEKMRDYVDEELKAAIKARDAEIAQLKRDWSDSQRSQDNAFGEVGAALRRAIEGVEKEMHKIELWGRDNYVKIPDFEKAVDRLELAIKSSVTEIKEDIHRVMKPS